MSIRHLVPIEHFGRKFDRGMTLFEFDAHREPEATRFREIGEYVKARCEMNEIPQPKMLYEGEVLPDLYISNQIAGLPGKHGGDAFGVGSHARNKRKWNDSYSLEVASIENHGEKFHEEYIEPMAWKIAGCSTKDICARYHRGVWLPLYFPETLQARTSLHTPFHYPRAGYAGVVAERMGGGGGPSERQPSVPPEDISDISLAFLTLSPRERFSVLLVVDPSPIYRITDMEVCAGIQTPFHRWIVEYRQPCAVMAELQRLGLCTGFESCAFGTARLPLPTIKNVRAGWKPKPHINDQLWEIMNAEARP